MAAFRYQEIFEHGEDTTEYRLLTSDHVTTASFSGREMLQVDPRGLEMLAEAAFRDVSHLLRSGHLKQLETILKNINFTLFLYHVNRDKNDFSNWIEDVFGYQDLAKRIKYVNTPKRIIEIFQEYFDTKPEDYEHAEKEITHKVKRIMKKKQKQQDKPKKHHEFFLDKIKEKIKQKELKKQKELQDMTWK